MLFCSRSLELKKPRGVKKQRKKSVGASGLGHPTQATFIEILKTIFKSNEGKKFPPLFWLILFCKIPTFSCSFGIVEVVVFISRLCIFTNSRERS